MYLQVRTREDKRMAQLSSKLWQFKTRKGLSLKLGLLVVIKVVYLAKS